MPAYNVLTMPVVIYVSVHNAFLAGWKPDAGVDLSEGTHRTPWLVGGKKADEISTLSFLAIHNTSTGGVRERERRVKKVGNGPSSSSLMFDTRDIAFGN